MKVTKDNKRADNSKGIWHELGRNESLMIQETKDERVKGKSEANIEEGFI